MKQFLPTLVITGFLVTPLFALQHSFDSQTVKLNELPAAAQKAVTAKTGNAPIQDIDRETFDGFTTYQVEFNKDGKRQELRVDSAGNIYDARWREIPPAVERSAQQYIANEKIIGLYQHPVNGQPVYHFRYDHNGTPTDIWFAQNGNVIPQPAGADILESAGAGSNPSTSGQTVAVPPAVVTGGTWTQFKDLPFPVQQTITKQAGGSIVQRAYKTDRDEQSVYYAAFEKESLRTRLAVRQDGALLEIITGTGAATAIGGGETSDTTGTATVPLSNGVKVNFNDLPPPVKDAIHAQMNGATIEAVAKGTIDGQTVYEAALLKDGKTYAVRVKEDGSVLGGY